MAFEKNHQLLILYRTHFLTHLSLIMNLSQPYKILLVEDDTVDQMAFKRMVRKQKLGYDYQIASSAAEAREILAEEKFDLVITDFQLGDENAFSFFDILTGTPFIFATGGGDEEIAVKALKSGAHDYLVKDANRNYLKILPHTIENAIKRSKTQEQIRLLESVVVNANDAVFIAQDIEGSIRIIYINRAFEEMTGYNEKAIIGRSAYVLAGEQSNKKEVDKITNAIFNKKDVKSELMLYRKDGSTFWGSLSMVALKDELGRMSHVVAILRDVSERKKAEQELIEAKQAAERARAAEQQFLASMSHEIRTPMNAVIGMTHLLFDTNPTEKQKEYLQALKFSADSLMGIISDILDLSKIEANKIEFEERQFNLFELILSLQKAFLFRLKEKDVKVVTDLDLSIENDVIGDPTRLNQILTNLLGNAAKFTEKGEIGLVVRLLEHKDGIYNIEFKAFDTGIGIAKDQLGNIFQNFKQANNQITRKYGGTGLGLPIVKSLVEMQGGKIWVESTVGEGTTFIFRLPFKDSGITSVAKSTDVARTVVHGEASISHLNILVAEDNPMNQKLISEILNRWKCQYDIALNGQEAIQMLEKNRYDIILMDVNMPIMDGYTATEEIRKSDNHTIKKIPIIALTAAALSSEKEKVFTVGMNEYVTKPFVPAQLKEVILKLTSNVSVSPVLHDEDESMKATPTTENLPQEDTTTSEEVAINLDYLNNFSGGDKGFMAEMISIFLGQAPADADLLLELLEAKNWDSLGKLAHKMKPNFMMMGMSPQQEIAKSIEIMGKSGEIDEAQITSWTTQLAKATKAAIPLVEVELARLQG